MILLQMRMVKPGITLALGFLYRKFLQAYVDSRMLIQFNGFLN